MSESIVKKIRALRAKMADQACTEAEVAEAAILVAKLMSKYDLDEASVAEQEKIGAIDRRATDASKNSPLFEACWSGIERFTETKAYFEKGLRFVGTPPDVEMALYLTELIEASSKRGWAEVCGKFVGSKDLREQQTGFFVGYGNRIHTRLMAMAEDRSAEKRTSVKGTALVISKGPLIAAAMAANGLVLRKGRKTKSHECGAQGYSAGHDAGSKVKLNTPIKKQGE